ncbi:hypothetical protein QPK87_01530 [Kamptonema cortianum]|nr:hypothetical protein [Geitlerinema splendidum]MDK3155269.1 hypothetical protein [Kamptonema cortianum]
MSEPSLPIECAVPSVLTALNQHIQSLCADGASAFQQGDLQRAEMLLSQAKEAKELQDRLKSLSSKLTKYSIKSIDVQKTSEGSAEVCEKAVVKSKTKQSKSDPAEVARQNKIKRLRRLQSDWQAQVEDLVKKKEWGEDDIAIGKALCCTGRALDEEFSTAGVDERSLDHELAQLKKAFECASEGIPFFGFNPTRQHSVEIWESLSETYRLMSTAANVLDWLEETPDVDEERLRILVTTVAAVETWLYRQFSEAELRVSDAQQQEFNSRVRAFSEDTFYVPWWNMNPDAKVTTSDVADHARQLPALFKMQKEAHERARAKGSAEEILDRVLETDEAIEDFPSELIQAVGEVFDAGVPPSDKKLRTRLAPYRQYLEDTDHGQIKKLNEYLKKDAMAMIAKKGDVKDPESSEPPRDPEFEAMLAKVKERLQGKTVLFIGGNKGQAWRIPAYVSELGLKDLVWPDAEDKTKPSDLAGEVKNCDVAVLLIRFARHSFKQVLDEAKEAGKETVTLSRGLNLRTFVQAYCEQVLQEAAVR